MPWILVAILSTLYTIFECCYDQHIFQHFHEADKDQFGRESDSSLFLVVCKHIKCYTIQDKNTILWQQIA